jgi:hypothetical protein
MRITCAVPSWNEASWAAWWPPVPGSGQVEFRALPVMFRRLVDAEATVLIAAVAAERSDAWVGQQVTSRCVVEFSTPCGSVVLIMPS